MNTASPSPNELGDFLKARRAALSPRTVGLPDEGTSRRVAGLRREEVALLASISTDYYTRIEQGRRRASPTVLGILSDVLRLNEDERIYMRELAEGQAGQDVVPERQSVQPQLQRVLDGLSDIPALVIGRRTDVLAWNPMAVALLTDFAVLPPEHRNYAWLLFRDPAFRTLYRDFEQVATVSVAMLRREAGHDPHDRSLARLVDELCQADEQFRTWWNEHHVAVGSTGTKEMRHPVVGDLSLDWDALTCAHDPTQRLIVWTAEPGTPSHERLDMLASLVSRNAKSGASR
ncbi:helix-turn-helix domain-containing protein [Streptomyces cinereoruber]|uniref:XRE family transcriptional regulator n=1 Tax=Streptomyces cinereoruber TaxID=67260 RepID=A0ABX6BLA7_9ACTN|nr:helix-turn-helix transcriptional regulator [Streptomyces cinereoruber]MBB4162296.1 transcriptional regulator with XRE-family HTH domain [Streptomyces cinereoruber]MBY8820086.1 helix-turn-helix transcriptional regulator [Streptomyces cinereoruber]NIH63399.1 transcriptional regulator with XRE-family HTH domain [Streptomyces cinereoruber]QEV36054.1 XRE family transcriptional regulator [Streptomyces cinereoruber]